MRRSATTLVTIFFYFTLLGQEKLFKQKMFKDLKLTNAITKSSGDSTFTFHVEVLEDEMELQTTKRYYWFDQGEVKSTQGNYAGKLLHGPYTKFDRNGTLLEKGSFSYGLRTGTWLLWHPNGNISRKYVWRQGDRIGNFEEFYPNGTPYKGGEFKRGRLHGKVYTYDIKGAVVTQETYRNGKIVKQKQAKAAKPVQNDTAQTKKKRWFKKKAKDTISTAPVNPVITPPAPAVEPEKKSRKRLKPNKPEAQPSNEITPPVTETAPPAKKKKREKKEKPQENPNQ